MRPDCRTVCKDMYYRKFRAQFNIGNKKNHLPEIVSVKMVLR